MTNEQKSGSLSSRGVFLIVAVALAGGAGAFVLGSRSGTDDGAGSQDPIPLAIGSMAIPTDTPRRGAAVPKVTFVEVADFECSYCGKIAPEIRRLEEKYAKDVAFVYLPVAAAAHQRALPAGIAALAAGKQGKFWEFRDVLFANQSALTDADLETYARSLGLDVARWKKDLSDPALANQMKANLRLAKNDLGVTGTPGFFVNGRRLSGSQSVVAFQGLLEEQIRQAGELIAKGTPRKEVSAKLTAQELGTATAAAAKGPVPGKAAAAMVAPGGPVRVVVAMGQAPIRGATTAPVTMVVFSEFECPLCADISPTLKRLEEEYHGRVRIAFKHLPRLADGRAAFAAEAAMAAHEQGKFWEYHDRIFANQKALDRPTLEKYAAGLGLDMKRFRAALDKRTWRDHVQADAKQGAGFGVRGTPTLFINGRRIDGAAPYDMLKELIEDELKRAKT